MMGSIRSTLLPVAMLVFLFVLAMLASTQVRAAIDPSLFTCGVSTVQDADGNIYGTTDVNGQCWMTENVRVGAMVQGSIDQTDNGSVEKYCYNNDPANCATDGGLYQWDEAMQYSTAEGAQGICPAGWHVPTDGEWYALENHLTDDGQLCDPGRDGSNKAYGWSCFTAGTKLKTGTAGMSLPLTGGRLLDGSYLWRNVNAYLWSSNQGLAWTELDPVHPVYIGSSTAWGRFLTTYSGWSDWDRSGVSRFRESHNYGFSVRCLKDATGSEPTNTPPVIKIKGDNPLTITQGSTFDPWEGVTITDAEDGPIATTSASVTGVVDTNTPGEYTLEYTVIDSDGLFGTRSVRLVTVINIITPKIDISLRSSTKDKPVRRGEPIIIRALSQNWRAQKFEWDHNSDGIFDAETQIRECSIGDYCSRFSEVRYYWFDEGVHTITARVTDSSGNTATESIEVEAKKEGIFDLFTYNPKNKQLTDAQFNAIKGLVDTCACGRDESWDNNYKNPCKNYCASDFAQSRNYGDEYLRAALNTKISDLRTIADANTDTKALT